MFPLAQNALSHLQVRNIQQMMARQSHQKRTPDFHDKYGNAVLASGAAFCVAVWTYTATQIGVEWNLSPVGRVTPKGMERLVIIPAGVTLNCFKISL
ncbi:cytochrome c oxidase subunit 7B, mitochondrial-like [Talpa occidentalis]|uniref:cytochrome c oxidase subunit 7B, mitochondrial-like n=1 Tax=Talpa occidentalis TaxID=50954 RepID=UPI00189052E7|nr:cytochrome c oxidase subunit 7B, mitochondrial-like [Talpa occidentalis]